MYAEPLAKSLLTIALLGSATLRAASPDLPRATPESQGVSSKQVRQFIEAADKEINSMQISNGDDPTRDWTQGYGFQFWRSRHGAYRGDGKDGQFCLVLPDQDAVIAITANAGNMQAQLDLVWEHLLPAFHDETLPEDEAEYAKLQATTSALSAKR